MNDQTIILKRNNPPRIAKIEKLLILAKNNNWGNLVEGGGIAKLLYGEIGFMEVDFYIATYELKSTIFGERYKLVEDAHVSKNFQEAERLFS